ncbi:hypothetical protein RchiOBHm_Chr1g0313681 [Rosa chinensis]|uniref:Retroviral polymerase SH3-like domain-containing protein n=1 Tax=Rosa chinensis TaxID=74649 RepID=A0A2P6S707_ROSCH|nr:hypothetical protein RchiOBHm_Chr1g0313681 [Rosa chinensis]
MSSPYIELFGSAPDLKFLRIFGTACYPYLRPYSQDKLDPRTVQCVFLGYDLGYKGVFCYNIEKNKLWMSRHVVHDETIFPYHFHSPSSSSKQCSSSSTSFQYSSPSMSTPQSHVLPVLHSNQLQIVLPFASSSQPSTGSPPVAVGGGDNEIGSSGSNESSSSSGSSFGSARSSDDVVGVNNGHNNVDLSHESEEENGVMVQSSEVHPDIPNGHLHDTLDGQSINAGLNITDDLPHELQFIEDTARDYNSHSMLTRAKNGIFK